MINKRTSTAVELQKLIQADVDLIKEVITDGTKVVVGLPYWHEIDGNGCNWNISNVKNISGYEGDIADIVRKYMQIYNLPNP
jgi:hypothetical protein